MEQMDCKYRRLQVRAVNHLQHLAIITTARGLQNSRLTLEVLYGDVCQERPITIQLYGLGHCMGFVRDAPEVNSMPRDSIMEGE